MPLNGLDEHARPNKHMAVGSVLSWQRRTGLLCIVSNDRAENVTVHILTFENTVA